MRDYRTRKKTKRPFTQSWFFLAFLFLVLIFFVRSAYGSFIKKKRADQEREKYEERYEELLHKKESLEDKINNLKTERGIEGEIRKRFNVTREGETMIRIVEE